MAYFRIRISLQPLETIPKQYKMYYARLPDFGEAQNLALHTASSFNGGTVHDVAEVSFDDLVEEVKEASFIYLE
jgi:hypothetical protein